MTITEEVSPLVRYYGKPMVPNFIKKFRLPEDSEVDSVSVNLSDPIEINNIFIYPAPKPTQQLEYIIDNETYFSTEPYPGKNDEYEVLDHITWKEVVIRVFPIQYFPVESRIVAYKNASVSLVYWTAVEE